ncbi:MAG TPA: pullulanase-associated domain-containing protein, partial [Albitalea sp.]
MQARIRDSWARALACAGMLLLAVLMSACGGGGGSSTPVASDLELGNTSGFQTVLAAVPAASAPSNGGGATSLTIHYRRLDGDTTGWQVHAWGAGKDPGWNAGWNPSRHDAFGAVYEIPLESSSGDVGYLFHKGDTKDHGGADQSLTLKAGANEIWRIEGDSATYTHNPVNAAAPDLKAVRVHYKRYDGHYDRWGVHIWAGSGIDTA